MLHSTTLVEKCAKEGVYNICTKKYLKHKKDFAKYFFKRTCLLTSCWEKGNRNIKKKNSNIYHNFMSVEDKLHVFNKSTCSSISIRTRNYHHVISCKRDEVKKENAENNRLTHVDVEDDVKDNVFQLKNRILNRHEQVHLSTLDIDQEIRNNLKLILKIDKLYMYQYIIFHEILKNRLKNFLVYNKTGTGKTLCYLLPLIQRLKNEKFDYTQKICILTQNIHLCKQLYMYILSIYPNLNVCILSDDNDSKISVEKDSSTTTNTTVVSKEFLLDRKENTHFSSERSTTSSDIWKEENVGIHFYLCTPKKLEWFLKNQKKGKSSKKERNIWNTIFRDVSTIVIDEFDYIVENRQLIFQFFFWLDVEHKKKPEMSNNTYDGFNWGKRNMYLFTANMNDMIKKKIGECLDGFVFFDFVNGNKEILQAEKNKKQTNTKSLHITDSVIQILSRENKNPSLCSLNVSHFICKINSASKYKYVSYFLNEFFFLKNEKKNYNKRNSEEKITANQDDILFDYMTKESLPVYKNEERITKCIIFANSREEVERLYSIAFLKPHATILHSELLPIQKDEHMNLFRMGKKTILITTDIVNRGMDIDHIIFILNFSPPTSPNDYIHRSGRTGRGKEKGICLTIYHKHEYKQLSKIMNFTKNEFEVIACPDVKEVHRFSVDKLIDTIMKTDPEEYNFLNGTSENLLKKHKTKIIAQILSLLLKHEKTSYDASILSGKKNYVAVLIKDPFFEMIKNKEDIVNMFKQVLKQKNVSTIFGDVAKCDEGFLVDISSAHVNKVIQLFNSTETEYRKKGVEINTIIELPMVIKEKKKSLRKSKKVPWVKYKLQKKKVIVLGSKFSKYKKKKKNEIIEEIGKPFEGA